MGKKYVDIQAVFSKEGRILPQYIIWEDGRRFEIDRVRDIRPAASLKAGGAGTRYTCDICGHTRYIFLEETRWFVEMG